MKDLIKKWWLGVIIITFICFILYIYTNSNSSMFSNYKKQSITVLKGYINGELSNKETSDKLEVLSKKLMNEYEADKNKNNMFYLETKLSLISMKLFREELSNTEINKYIEEIKMINE